ncbi:sensor histidine kinase [Microbacterium sp.]|uniref:sensor histidine kinase n=1 Tax=Microbacterium sp. TaxID=51671 RepID=UPI0027375B66|nr:histidine kinase [Microbacterium sp.]MDP3949077.1 histidine kinase [Microbacterium sp.]
MLRSRTFWQQRSLHSVARLLLVLAVGVLLCVAVGFILASGEFARYDLLAIALYLGLAAFAWHPMTAAFIVMFISSVGVVFTGSGGDLLELAIALSLVAATCVPWVIVTHAVLLGALTAYVAIDGATLTGGGIFAIAGIAAIAFLAGLAFRLVAAREMTLLAERARVVEDLELIAREEQERIADELHDGIAHDLTLILFHARALPKQPDEASRQVSLSTIEESAEQALESIQSLLSLIRDTKTEAPGTHLGRYDGRVLEAISSLGTLLEDAGIPTRVTAPNDPLQISPLAERLLTEIAIEAVTNIIKHAPDSQSASMEIQNRPGAVELVVQNVASAGPPRSKEDGASGGRGLSRAGQRLAHTNGQLESGRTVDGWILRATLPTAVHPGSATLR